MRFSDLDDKEEIGETPVMSTGEVNLIEDETGEKALLARIPLLSGSLNKARYRSYRATGFPVMEACQLAGITHPTVMSWRKNDPEFADIELNKLPELQKTTAGDIIMMEFDRNMRLALNVDFKVLYKAACSVDTLSQNEMKAYLAARPHYRPAERMSLENAMKEPEERTAGELKVTVEVDGQVIEDIIAKQAGLNKLLQAFEINKQVAAIAEPAIEGEFREVPDEVPV